MDTDKSSGLRADSGAVAGHTPGALHATFVSERSWNKGIYDESGNEVALVKVKSAFVAPRKDADARRLVACWNACAEVPTEKLEEAALHIHPHSAVIAVRCIHAEQQRDDLLAALIEAVALIESLDGRDNSCDPITDISDLRAAIARAQGE